MGGLRVLVYPSSTFNPFYKRNYKCSLYSSFLESIDIVSGKSGMLLLYYPLLDKTLAILAVVPWSKLGV